MTREEAIKILRREIECLSHTKCEDCILEVACNPIITTPYDSEYIEVYEMAISALSENTGDLISKQEALKPYEKLNDNDVISVWLIRKNLEEQKAVADIMECARAIKEYCKSKVDYCTGCPFESKNVCECELSRMMLPCEWSLPEGEKADMIGEAE